MEKIPITSPLSTEEPARSLSEAIAVIDAGGIVRFATPTIAAYYGYPLEAIIGGRAIEFIAPESRDYVRERWNALLAHPERMSDTFSLSIQTAAGQRIPIRASVWRLPGRDEFLLLHHVIERVRDRLDTLYAIQAAVSSMLDVEKLMETVLNEVRRLIPCSSCAIFFLERDKTVQVRRWHNEAIERHRSLIRESPPELETSRFLRETSQPLIINDTLTDPRWRELPSRRPIRSWLGAPLVHHGQFLGELNLDSPDPNQFSQEDAELAHALATQIAAALYNARQYQDEQRHAERLRVLNEISLAISQLDLTSVLEMIYQYVARLMDASTFFIGLLDAEAHVVHIVGSYDFGQRRPDEFQGADEGITGLVLRTRRPLILHDTENEPVPPEIIIQDEMPRSVLMMPLLVKDEIVGVISVQSYEPNSYTQDDIDLLETIAGTIAVAVRNAQLYDQTAERLHALETLHKMSLELAAVQNPEAVARLVTEAAAELFAPDDTHLLLSPGQPWDAVEWHCPRGGRAAPVSDAESARAAALAALCTRVQNTSEPIFMEDTARETAFAEEVGEGWPGRAVAVVPIARGGTTFAMLALFFDEPRVFRADMRRILDLLCLQGATAFENARYTLTLQRSLSEVSGLHELARHVSEMEQLDDVLNAVVTTIRDVYQCFSASIALLDEATNEVVTLAGANLTPEQIQAARFKYGEHVAGEVVATGRVVYVPDTQADPRFRVIVPEIRSLLVVPLTVHGRTIGSLGIDSTQPDAFTPDHERMLTIAGGQIAAIIETLRLLRETRERADELARANALLQAQDALRKELVYQVSHDLRSPLQIVYGYAGMMYDGDIGPVTPYQQEVLDHIIRRSKAIERMTQDIMAAKPISRETLELGTVNVSELCAQAVASAQVVHRDRPHLTFRAEIAEEPILVEGDYNRLTRTLDNLIGNAVKFSPQGGTVVVRVTRDAARNCAVVSVSDEGIGIPADRMPFLFERFFRAHRGRFDGSGLGLYNVQQIVHAHNGQVWAESEEGRGSTFTFTLPLAAEASAAT